MNNQGAASSRIQVMMRRFTILPKDEPDATVVANFGNAAL
jgi:hypothetical protein